MSTGSRPSLAEWQRRAQSLHPQALHWIDGRAVPAADGATLATLNPANGQVLAEVARGQSADVDRAVRSARQAWRDRRWRGLAPTARMAVLLRWADLIEAHSEELALMETLDMGKPISDVLDIDLPEVLNTLRYFAQCIDKIEGAVTHTAPQSLHLITHEPLGVVGAISPWNYPMLMAMWKLAPILAAGNCVVHKPAEQAPLSCVRLAQLFVEAGGPPGVFNLVNGTGLEAGQALARHPDVDKITFTGSTAVGKRLLGYAGESNMKRVALETGGKSPQIFMADLYDLDAAVERAIGGIFDNAGQVCNAGSRLLVQRELHDRFVERFVALSGQRYRCGDPLDPATTLGPLVGRAHQQKVLQHIARAQQEGCTLAMGGQSVGEGCHVTPTLLTGAHNQMAAAREEIFGPVAVLMPFDTEEEAIALANDSDYGLAAAVWSSDLKRAHRMVGQLEAGVVWVNCFGDGDMTQPFGGFKQSGNSRDKHMASLLSYTQSKSAWFDLA
jgi:acyl-CoA reductase-like NAD-dependent aldehyde dehydrogenase